MKTNTFQLETAYYCAGVVFDVKTRKCIEAAPILHWMVGMTFDYVKSYCTMKGIKMTRVKDAD